MIISVEKKKKNNAYKEQRQELMYLMWIDVDYNLNEK